jgi:hypothetical protein
MTAGERQFELCQALKAHKFELDNVRGVSALRACNIVGSVMLRRAQRADQSLLGRLDIAA